MTIMPIFKLSKPHPLGKEVSIVIIHIQDQIELSNAV